MSRRGECRETVDNMLYVQLMLAINCIYVDATQCLTCPSNVLRANFLCRRKNMLNQRKSDKDDVNKDSEPWALSRWISTNDEDTVWSSCFSLTKYQYMDFSFVCSGHIEIKHKTFYGLSKEIPDINDEPYISQIDIRNTTGVSTIQEETDGEPKVCLCFAVVSPKQHACFINCVFNRISNSNVSHHSWKK